MSSFRSEPRLGRQPCRAGTCPCSRSSRPYRPVAMPAQLQSGIAMVGARAVARSCAARHPVVVLAPASVLLLQSQWFTADAMATDSAAAVVFLDRALAR